MDFRELEYFLVISQEKNLTHAAEKLYVSQPALSKFLQRLEQEQGLPLFTRIGRELHLTYAGERFQQYALQLLSTKNSLDKEMKDLKKETTGRLNIGMAPVRCSLSLPEVLPAFHKLYPDIHVEILDTASATLDEALFAGQLDLLFYNLSERRPGIHYEILKNEEIFAVFPQNHPIRQKAVKCPGKPDGIYLEWLKDEILLLQDRTQRQGQYMLRELAIKNMVPRKIQLARNISAAVSLAANGYGVAFVSGSFIEFLRNRNDFDYYSLLDVDTPFYFTAAWREKDYLPGYAHRFVELMREIVNK